MKRLLFGFVLGILLSHVANVRAGQDAPKVPAQAPAHLTHDITASELVEVMADFDILHREQQPFFQKAYGVSDFTATPPTVWIFAAQTFASKRSTVIHEVLHIRCNRDGIECPEAWVADEEVRQYQKMFGLNLQ